MRISCPWKGLSGKHMRMRNAFIKDGLRKVRASIHRFLAILVITAMGVAFFAGLRATGPDMRATAQTYFGQTNFMDIRLLSGYGFNDEDLAAIRGVSGVLDVMPAYSLDALAQLESANMTVRLQSLPEDSETAVNKTELLDGRMPQNGGECLADERFIQLSGASIGDTVRFLSGSDTPLSDSLAYDSYTIVGIARSPLYISTERGSSSVGSGKAEAFFLMPAKDFKISVYTEVYLTIDNPEDSSRFDDAYESLVDAVGTQLEDLGETRSKIRYDEAKAEATEELDKAQKKVDDGYAALADGQEQLDSAKQELSQGKADYAAAVEQFQSETASARTKLTDAQTQIEKGFEDYNREKAAFEQQMADAQAQIDKGYDGYEDGLARYEEGVVAYEQGKAEIESVKAALFENKEAYETAYARWASAEEMRETLDTLLQAGGTAESLAAINAIATQLAPDRPQLAAALDAYAENPGDTEKYTAAQDALTVFGKELEETQTQLEQTKEGLDVAEAQLADEETQLTGVKAELDNTLKALNEGKAQLDGEAEALQSARAEGEASFEAAGAELSRQKAALTSAWQELERQEASGEAQLLQAKAELAAGEAEYQQNLAAFHKTAAQAREELNAAQSDIDAGQDAIDQMELPQWYVLDHETNMGFLGYKQDAMRIEALSLVVPVLFFLVAVLVTMTSMTRLVESDRSQIGTLKAMGYSDGKIAMRYLWYAIAASATGAVIGLFAGFNIFPRLVFNAYAALYTLPSIQIQFNWPYALVSLGLAIGCAALPAYFVCLRSMREVPSQLMRPVAPAIGKKTLLERMTFLWKRFNFSQKVALRNLFRYKKRLIMTILGVAGCTALMFTGFGLQDAVSTMVSKQYDKLQHYDLQVDLQKNLSDSERAQVEQLLDNNSQISSYIGVSSETVDAISGGTVKSAYLEVADSTEEMGNYVLLQNRQTGEKLSPDDNSVVLTEKLADLLGVSVGDEITLRNADGAAATVLVGGISENYVYHYIYMTPALYQEAFGDKPQQNQLWCLLTGAEEGQKRESLSESLLSNASIASISFTSDMQESMESMVGALRYIVAVLILSAAALVFVVLFSLTTISLEERGRELATIKVLGFFDRELAAYVYRENAVLTVLGIGAGLLLGVLLQRYIIGTMEIDMIMFSRDLLFSSYVLSAGLTLVFALIVNFIMLWFIKRIDMVSSLKSVE